MENETKPASVEPMTRPPIDEAQATSSLGVGNAFARRAGALWPKSRRGRVLVLAVVFLTLMGLVAWWWFGTGTTVEILVVPVERGDVEDNVTALGNLQPRDFVDVGAQVSGLLKKLNVEVGARVKVGDLLAEIDPAVLNTKVDAGRAQLRNLRAQLADRQSQLELARGQYARQKMLKAERATSEDAYQIALSGMRSAEAGLNAIKAQIEQTTSTVKGDEVTLGYTKIYAPISGTVVSITAKQGQTLNANQQAPVILRVADLKIMTVWTQVSEADVPKLKTGMDAYFTILGTPGKRWRGKLRQILPTPENVNNVVLYTALFEVDNAGGELMTQMTAQVFFVIAGKEDVVNVPVAALRRFKPRQKLYKVTLVDANGKQQEREVKVGVMNRVAAEVISGLAEGDRVVAGTKSATSSAGSRNGNGNSNRQGGFRGFP
ncbi:MAG: efflux RND transporter periplasmic adaptor subunit [Micropepsaceae bacterium]